MNEEQVNILGVQLLEGFLNRLLGVLIAAVADPDLCGQEDIVPLHTAVLDAPAHGFLVAVSLSGVDRAVAHLDGIPDTAVTLRIGDLVHAVAQHGHFDSVVESDIFHFDNLRFYF